MNRGRKMGEEEKQLGEKTTIGKMKNNMGGVKKKWEKLKIQKKPSKNGKK